MHPGQTQVEKAKNKVNVIPISRQPRRNAKFSAPLILSVHSHHQTETPIPSQSSSTSNKIYPGKNGQEVKKQVTKIELVNAATGKYPQTRSSHATNAYLKPNNVMRNIPHQRPNFSINVVSSDRTSVYPITVPPFVHHSYETIAYVKPNMMKRTSLFDNHEGEKKVIPAVCRSTSRNQPILKIGVSVADEAKKKAASGSSRSFCDAHKQRQEKEKGKSIKMVVGQSSKCSCGICFDSKPEPDMFRSGKCNHPFCTDCISKHVAAQIQQNVLKVNCPSANCCVELKLENLRPILSKDVVARWESAKYESSVAWWQKCYCPFKDCSVLLVNDGDKGKVVTSSECPSCHRLFCAQCKVPWHAEMNCEKFQMSKRKEGGKDWDRKLVELAKKEMWQRCPKCSIYVQRLGGCEHMTCRCGCSFCYQCGKNWKHGHQCITRPST